MLFVNFELRVHPDFLDLKFLTMVLQKIAAGDFSPNVSHLISASKLIALDKGGEKNRPIAIGVVMRCFIPKALMPASITEERAHLALLQMGRGVKYGLNFIAHDTRNVLFKLCRNPTYIGVSVDSSYVLNKTGRLEVLRKISTHSPSLIMFATALYA